LEHAATILLVQVALGALALFVLADGPRHARDRPGLMALLISVAAAVAWTTWTQRWALHHWGHGAYAVLALAAAGCLLVCLTVARDLVRSSRAQPDVERFAAGYEFERGEDEWYVHNGDTEFGPYSTEELLERFENAEIASSHYLWKPGMDGWRRAYAVGLERGQSVPIPLQEPGHDPAGFDPDPAPVRGRR
jgi:hypothetical protein